MAKLKNLFKKTETKLKPKTEAVPKARTESVPKAKTQSKPKSSKFVDFSKYDNYNIDTLGNIQFLNPFTSRMIQVNKDTKICPITGKKF